MTKKKDKTRLHAERILDQQLEILIDHQRKLLAIDIQFFKTFSKMLMTDDVLAAETLMSFPPDDLRKTIELMFPFARLGWQHAMFKMQDKYTAPD